MNRNEVLQAIGDRLEPGERREDAMFLIDAVVAARARETAGELELAGKILCLIFDPVKVAAYDYGAAAKGLRKDYAGVAEEPSLQGAFRKSITGELLELDHIEQAVDLGIERLFVRDEFEPPHGAGSEPIGGTSGTGADEREDERERERALEMV